MSGPVADAPCGRIRGTFGTPAAGNPGATDVLRFDGIPFAAPPTGARRFLPPTAPAPFDGVLDATRPAPAPPQGPGPALGTRPVGATSEDCLHLNVVTPSLEGSRPVLVWIYGGGFVNGSAADPLHAGERLVARGDLVLVTFDYRLGALGFLHDPDHPNLGLLDQIAALRWVRAQIGAFGGDPERVTLFGESAGAMSIRALMATPAADELFAAAILQSGAALGVMSPAGAARVRECFGETVGSREPDDWRRLSVAALLEAQATTGAQIRAETGSGAWRPVVDGELVHTSGEEAQARAVNRQRPVLIGMNADEQRLFVNLRHPMRREDAAARLARALAGRTDDPDAAAHELLGAYARLDPEASEAQRLAAAETDLYYRIPMLRLCAARAGAPAPTFQYLFAWPSPALRGRLGACHALEVPFVFGTLDAPGMDRFAGNDAAARGLSDAMIDAWAAFAHQGTPECAAARDWRPWTPADRACWVADRAPHTRAAAGEETLDAWRSLWPSAPI
ncbi:MAG TPA: carboxylesterase family protein [Pseudomonadales bacterium]|nr:carboxylesterase family protein [Pseudomonadales bacterium]